MLVIEDEESYRQALSSGLGREGFDVAVAADGAEGLRLFAERPPDIVLLDMLLPGMHGIEVCRRLRSQSAVPIVMVSAVDAELDVVLGLRARSGRLRDQAVPPPRAGGPDAGHPPAGLAPRGLAPYGRGRPVGRCEGRPATVFGSVTVDFVRREVHGRTVTRPICRGVSSTCWPCCFRRDAGCGPGPS